MHDISVQPVSVLSDGGSHEGCLVFAGTDLVAVFTYVIREETAGGRSQGEGWFLEAGFGPCGELMSITPPVFATLDEALEWVRSRLQERLSHS